MDFAILPHSSVPTDRSSGGSAQPAAPPNGRVPTEPTTHARQSSGATVQAELANLLSQAGDLVVNVGQGLLRNQGTLNPDVFNSRLLDSAVAVVEEMLATAQAPGGPLFGPSQAQDKSPLSNYSKTAANTIPPRGAMAAEAEAFLIETSKMLQSLRASAGDDVNKSNRALERLEKRSRQLVAAGLASDSQDPLDKLV